VHPSLPRPSRPQCARTDSRGTARIRVRARRRPQLRQSRPPVVGKGPPGTLRRCTALHPPRLPNFGRNRFVVPRPSHSPQNKVPDAPFSSKEMADLGPKSGPMKQFCPKPERWSRSRAQDDHHRDPVRVSLVVVEGGRHGAKVQPGIYSGPRSKISKRGGSRDHHHRILRPFLCLMHPFSPKVEEAVEKSAPRAIPLSSPRASTGANKTKATTVGSCADVRPMSGSAAFNVERLFGGAPPQKPPTSKLLAPAALGSRKRAIRGQTCTGAGEALMSRRGFCRRRSGPEFRGVFWVQTGLLSPFCFCSSFR